MEPSKPITVLLIEDNPGDARLVKEALVEISTQRFTLVWVSDLAKGLAHLSGNPVDAILLDLTLPDSRGYDTFDRLHTRAQHIPTILLTGLDDEALASQAIRQGAQDYLVKGKVDHEVLARAIRYAIERKRAEERIQNLYAELQAIRNVNQLITKEKDRGRLLKEACRILTQGQGYSNAWIALIGAEGKLQTAFEAGLGEALLPLVEQMQRGQFPDCARRALNEPEGVIVTSPSSACGGCLLAHDFHERAAMAARLEYGDKVYGVATVYLTATLIGEEEQSLFHELSVDLAFALHAIEAGEEQRQAQEALRASEERYRMLAENMSDTVRLMDMNLKTTYISPSVTRLRGYSLDELNAIPLDQQMPPDSLERFMQLFNEVLSPENLASRDLPISRRIELEFYKKDGSKFWSENTFTLIRAQNGMPVAILGSGRDITKRKRAEDALRESEQRLRRFYESGMVGVIYWNMRGQITDANDKFLEMVGYTREELASSQIDWADMTPSEFRRLDDNSVAELKATGVNKTPFEKEYIRKNGTRIPIIIAGAMLDEERFNGIAFVLDITERKRAEDTLRALLRRHEALLAAVPEIVMEVDTHKVYTWANQVGLEFFGADVIGKEAVFYFEGEQDTYNTVKPLFNGDENTIYLESWQRRKDGQKRLLAWWCRTLKDDNGNVTGALSSARDITERKRAEDEIRKLNAELEERVAARTRELQEAQEKLVRQERLAVLGQLAGGVGHELRNPLAVIGNAIYFLRLIQPIADEKTKEYFGIIENEIRTADKIITDLLDYSRIKSVDSEPVTVAELFQRVLERYPAPTAVTVSVKIAARLPPVYVDPRQILQVLGNLVVNAYQAMPEGGELALSAKKKGDQAIISVQDAGAGISPENMDKLFEPLFTTKMHGIGLGLAVSKKLVEANNGRIEVNSTLGKGSTFSVYLPVNQEES